MNDAQLRSRLNFKGKKTSFEGLKRNIKQIDGNSTRYNRVKGLTTDFVNKEKTVQNKRRAFNSAHYVIGSNRFFEGMRKVQELNHNLSERQAIILTDSIIKKAKKNYKSLSSVQKQIIEAISP